MHAFIVHHPPDFPDSPDTLKISPDTSIGIGEVRQIQFFLSRKPIQSDHNTVVIADAHLLTLPAQHALLKTLEEPPPGALIYLVTTQPDSLLPTILSRVQIIPPPYKSYKSYETHKSYQVPEDITTRESALAFLDELEYLIHQDLNSLSPERYALIADTRKYLKANCNLKLCLSHLALGLQNC